MAQEERIREEITGPLTPDRIQQREAAGWRMAAVEWVRSAQAAETYREQVPFGMKVADDCLHLEPNTAEQEVLATTLEMIVQDRRLSQIADELNKRGHRTRQGSRWTAPAVFDLLPRLIDAGPRIVNTKEWAARRKQIVQAV